MSGETRKLLVIGLEDDGTLLLYREGSPSRAVRIEPDELGHVATALVASMSTRLSEVTG